MIFPTCRLDFHPTRQLLSQLKARGMYYKEHPELPDWQRQMAIQQWQTKAEVEPEVFERLVALYVSEPRVWSRGWHACIASVVLDDCRRLPVPAGARIRVGSVAALVSVGLLPVPALCSHCQSILPARCAHGHARDHVLVGCITGGHTLEAWSWAVIAGVVGGLAIYVKFVAAFFVIGAALGVGLASLRQCDCSASARSGSWPRLGILPAALYLYYGIVQQGLPGAPILRAIHSRPASEPAELPALGRDGESRRRRRWPLRSGLLGVILVRQKSSSLDARWPLERLPPLWALL